MPSTGKYYEVVERPIIHFFYFIYYVFQRVPHLCSKTLSTSGWFLLMNQESFLAFLAVR